MTHTPQPYPYTPYYAPPSVGPTARYAGILMLVLGAIALLMGGCVAGAGFAPEVQTNEAFEPMRAELDRAGVSLQAAFVILGIMIGIYALPAIVMGVILIRARSKAPAIVALVLVGLATLPMLLFIVVGLAQGQVAEAMFWVIAAALHGLLIMWLVQSLRTGATASPVPAYYPPQQYPQPMQGYQWQAPQQQQQPPPPQDRTGI